MELQKHFVAFIDILGFAQYVKDNSLTPEKPLDLLNKFIDISKELNLRDNLKITAFSDNIVISVPAKEPQPPFEYDTEYLNFILYINYMQIHILLNIGILPIRGGITFGDFYHDEILFGRAMIEAYNLERFHAFFPRIVVNPKFLEPNKFLAAHKSLSELNIPDSFPIRIKKYEPEKLERIFQVKYDFDGVLFCNYLSSLYLVTDKEWTWAKYSEDALDNHKNFILKNLLAAKEDLNVSRKYIWMKNYHNWFCKPFEEFQKYIIPEST